MLFPLLLDTGLPAVLVYLSPLWDWLMPAWSWHKIDWKDYTESIPAFLVVILMPLTFSIATGIAFGFISYAAIKLFTGKGKEVSWLVYILALLFILRFVYLQAR